MFGLGPLTSSQAIFVIATLATACCAFVLVFFREGTAPAESAPVKVGKQNPLKVLIEVTRESAFWRFMLFVTLLVFVRLIFQHAHLTWPKYTQREFGADFAFAAWWSINPALIIVFTPIATALTRRGSPFFWILVGSTITSVSVFFMAISTSLVASVLFIVTLSIGEMLWSPRLYEYTAAIAPKGRESTYMGLSDIPRFLAKPAVGFMSGWMLATYCPLEGARRSELMWGLIGALTLAGPVAILFLRKVIEGRKRSDAVPSTEESAPA